jgi:predicted nucleic acid-binding protein
MIVLDASVVVEILTNGPLADSLRRRLAEQQQALIVPHLLDVEVASALRRMVAGSAMDAHQCREILAELASLPAERYEHTPLLARIWELRSNFTAYDATYIALAEATGSTFYTCDAGLRKGHRADVEVFEA